MNAVVHCLDTPLGPRHLFSRLLVLLAAEMLTAAIFSETCPWPKKLPPSRLCILPKGSSIQRLIRTRLQRPRPLASILENSAGPSQLQSFWWDQMRNLLQLYCNSPPSCVQSSPHISLNPCRCCFLLQSQPTSWIQISLFVRIYYSETQYNTLVLLNNIFKEKQV